MLLLVAKEFPMELNQDHQKLFYNFNQNLVFLKHKDEFYRKRYFSARSFVGLRSVGGNER